MAESILILGKNAELSTAEVVAYLESRGVDFALADHTEKFVVVSMDRQPEGMEDALGGTIKYAQVLASGSSKESLQKGLEDMNMDHLPEKPLFAVSSYGAGQADDFREMLKRSLKSKGIKAGVLKQSSMAVSHTEIARRKLEGREFIICKGGGWWLGKTTRAHDPFDYQRRDVKRPEQRIRLSMPPRLARIMLNLALAKGKVLDPFCGLGTIIQEAALMGLEAYGSDIDEEAVKSCEQNMGWLEGNYKISKRPEVRRADVRDLPWPQGHFDAVVTEPVLGPTLKHYPKVRQAEAIIRKLEPLYRDSIKEMARVIKPGGRLVMTSPMFRVHSSAYSLGVKAKAEACGLEEIDPLEGRIAHEFPLADFEPRHRTLREVHVFQKPKSS